MTRHLVFVLLIYSSSYLCVSHQYAERFLENFDETLAQSNGKLPTTELPRPLVEYFGRQQREGRSEKHNKDSTDELNGQQQRSQRPTLMDIALQVSAKEGLNAMTQLYTEIEPDIIRNGQLLTDGHPGALLSKFSAQENPNASSEMAAYATISAAKAFRRNFKYINEWARQAHTPRISLRRTALEALCPPREPVTCMPASARYRTHDGSCNSQRRPRWGSSLQPFNRFLPPEYGDGVDSVRNSVDGSPLPSSRFVSLLVHGARDGEAPLTQLFVNFGQLLDHDMTSTAQPRSINGSIPSCCGNTDAFHPSCFPIKVPLDDPWLSPLKVRCLEFLRSAPAQRRDCSLSWREQTNQATSFIDASPIYSSSAKSSDNARVFRNGLLVFGRGNPAEDVCQRSAIATSCIRAGDGRSAEQPGLLALHHAWVNEHNSIATELSEMNPHWSDEKVYQETRRIIGAMFQHITYREFLPVVLGREVCKIFDLDLLSEGYYEEYDPKVNPTVANSFASAAFRFGHSLVQNSYIRCDRHHNVINNNVSLHEEFQRGDIGSAGSLHRLLRGMASQRALKRDEFITPELTNHLFQTPGFPFGLDLAAINIQRGRDHGVPPYTGWRVPCGLTPVRDWEDLEKTVGPESAMRIRHAYRSVDDIDLFVAGIAERPVMGGLVGPTFACIIAQQFTNSRKGDRFWYENGEFENSLTPAQLQAIRRVNFAQVICRTLGGGTLQPHVFLPPDLDFNQRLPCGVGPLGFLDLSAWLEQDPFRSSPLPHFAPPIPNGELPDHIFNIGVNSMTTLSMKEDSNVLPTNRPQQVHPTFTSLSTTMAPISVSRVDLIPNSSTGLQIPKNTTLINDKLDLRRRPVHVSSSKPISHRPGSGVSNKLDKNTRITLNIKGLNRRRIQQLAQRQTTTKRTVIVNNVPIELRSAIDGKANDATVPTDTTEEPTFITADTSEAEEVDTNHDKRQRLEARKEDPPSVGKDSEKQEINEVPFADTFDMTMEPTAVAPDEVFDIFTSSTDDGLLESHIDMTIDGMSDETGLFRNVRLNCHDQDDAITDSTDQSVEKNIFCETDTNDDSNASTEDEFIFDNNVEPLLAVTQTANTFEQRRVKRRHKLNDENDKDVTDKTRKTATLKHKPKTNRTAVVSTAETMTKLKVRSHSTAPRLQSSTVKSVGFRNRTTQLTTKTSKTTTRKTSTKDLTTSTSTTTEASKTTVEKALHLERVVDIKSSTPYKTSTTQTPKLSTKISTPTPVLTVIPKNAPEEALPLEKRLETENTEHEKSIVQELRQYDIKPHKVLVNGPNSDQYEIEINIRRQSSSGASNIPNNGISSYPQRPPLTSPSYNIDHTTAYKPLSPDRYSPTFADYGPLSSTSTPAYPYYQPTAAQSTAFVQPQRTRPPTIIYLNENEINDRSTTQRPPGFLQSFISFATSTFSGNRRPGAPSSVPLGNEKPAYGFSAPVDSNPISSVPYNPNNPPLNQVGGIYTADGSLHATTGAISAGGFGSVVDFTSSSGADGSIFSFNIRPKPLNPQEAQSSGVIPQNQAGVYGLIPPRSSPTDYAVTPQNAFYPNKDSSQSPFSTGTKRPQSSYYNRQRYRPKHKSQTNSELKHLNEKKPSHEDYDYSSRTLEPTTPNKTMTKDEVKFNYDDYEDYDQDYDDDSTPDSKFDRDGYLRPEHMLATLFKVKEKSKVNSNETLDDNYVLQKLNKTTPNLSTTELPIPMTHNDRASTLKSQPDKDIISKHAHVSNIEAESDSDIIRFSDLIDKFKLSDTLDPNTQDLHENRKRQETKELTIAFAPINVLTKPERPDNWVMFEVTAAKKNALPPPPPPPLEIVLSSSQETGEMPMPIKELPGGVWISKCKKGSTVKSNICNNENNSNAEDTKTQDAITTKKTRTFLDVVTQKA